MLRLVVASISDILSLIMFHSALMVFDTECRVFIISWEFAAEMWVAPFKFSFKCRVWSRPYESDPASYVKAVKPMKVIVPLL